MNSTVGERVLLRAGVPGREKKMLNGRRGTIDAKVLQWIIERAVFTGRS